MAGIRVRKAESPYLPGEPVPTRETRDKIVKSASTILGRLGVEPDYRYIGSTDVYNRTAEVTSADGHVIGITQHTNEMGSEVTVIDNDPSTEKPLYVKTANSGIPVRYAFYEGAIAEAPQIAQRLADLATEMATNSEE